MAVIIEPVAEPTDVPVLAPLLGHRADHDFVPQLEESLSRADDLARNGGLASQLYAALPLPG